MTGHPREAIGVCVPRDTPQNREWWTLLTAMAWPFPEGAPYPNSVERDCDDCAAPIWLAPITAGAIARVREAGGPAVIVCMLCAGLRHAEMVRAGAAPKVATLTDKLYGEGDGSDEPESA